MWPMFSMTRDDAGNTVTIPMLGKNKKYQRRHEFDGGFGRHFFCFVCVESAALEKFPRDLEIGVPIGRFGQPWSDRPGSSFADPPYRIAVRSLTSPAVPTDRSNPDLQVPGELSEALRTQRRQKAEEMAAKPPSNSCRRWYFLFSRALNCYCVTRSHHGHGKHGTSWTDTAAAFTQLEENQMTRNSDSG